MGKDRHTTKCTCGMNPKIYRRPDGWRVECNYCGKRGEGRASKDDAVRMWREMLVNAEWLE